MTEPTGAFQPIREFRVPFDARAQQSTVLYVFLLLLSGFAIWTQFQHGSLLQQFIAILFVIALLIPYLLHTRSYEFTSDRLRCKRWLAGVSVEISAIRGWSRVPEEEVEEIDLPLVRRMGIFGYTGQAKVGQIPVRILANSLRALVRIHADTGDLLLGPDDPDEFIRTLETVCPPGSLIERSESSDGRRVGISPPEGSLS